MTKDKQIKEMQNDLIEISKSPIMIDGLEHWSDVIAEELIGKGYRKASEVASEIFEEIEEIAGRIDRNNMSCLRTLSETTIEKLKKKYTEDCDG